MTIEEITRRNYKELPKANGKGEYDSIYFFPTRKMHKSGWKCIAIIGKNKDGLYLLSDWSDVINIDGISGRGRNWRSSLVLAKGWTIDCMDNGIFHIWCTGDIKLTTDEWIGSSCEIFGEQK